MLYRYSEIFRTMMMMADLGLLVVAWMGAYFFRFHTGVPAPLGIPEPELYTRALLVILPVWWMTLRRYGLYQPRRLGSLLSEATDLLRASAVALLLLVAISFFVRSTSYSRAVVVSFSVLAPMLLFGSRLLVRTSLRRLRRRGLNRRFAVVVGGGRLAREIIERLHAQPQAGLYVQAVLAEGEPASRVAGVPVLGGYSALKEVLQESRIDQVIIALPRGDWQQLDKILADLDDEIASVKLAPDLLHVMTLRSSVEDLEGLPIISLRESPLVGWASVQKRAVDMVVSSLLLFLLAPILCAIACCLLASSGRPVFYRQRRTGLDGRVFSILKFRTMETNAEEQRGPVWALPEDPRCTPVGRWLRRFSLDELPQLWNVLRGDMSMVGPRPERPALIEEFRSEIPGYMLRHKVKAGVTGWAQVHGWRGNTSLRARIEHDLYYIQNWSMGLDLQILLMTLWSSLAGRNAY